MDFIITEDQATLTQGVRDYLAGVHGPELLRALDTSDSRRSADVWRGLVEMGLPGLLVPEARGGLGLSLLDAVLIAAELGRAGVAEPLADTALVAAPLLAKAGGQDALLGAIAAGEAKVALQHPVNPWVADLEDASHILSVKNGALLLTERSGDSELLDSVDPLRRLYAPVAASGVDVGSADALLDHAALIAAAQLVGVADAMLEQATDYAKNRSQFGQPIGSFQAVKHHLATAVVKIEFAKPVIQRAAVALAEGTASASVHVSHAKLAAADAAWAMSETAIQTHGAMGYTYEVDLHFWMKRAWALAGAWGDRAFHLARIDAAVIGGALPIGPGHSFA
ncbi:acyl-CoA dehydrogenase [Sphingopyxis sp. H038]|uniref:acyl-CoA dehydrogenase family protein n=1 Tax=unclassified Sphingopyxis TaxID=2614943 RepID=UPI000730126D|nr:MULTISPECIES: acyl-CoA dehydrogenase family protein [unclassified Sphingopyxis]KTE04244.1 acyl-CoA dehydrogenase [Sphingopyxis sp. H012]KTE13554.1 acyl-CoA dehydrogenase [Sphingopyxis sp. H053]KTE15761.1 acyl-CoA dehydrogenase [Sphingopyxis sp. H093]KTE15768.1 acyl-CoA dehydrogenase [Sphingopyxis sp. H093]KTE30252.1 acyl-CoA dehydrogenase [Sphingopyxis sp. H080]